MGIVKDTVENLVKAVGNAELIRKNRLIKTTGCVLVLFAYFNCMYWNIYSFIDLPMAPKLPAMLDLLNMDWIVLIWLVLGFVKVLFNKTLLITIETKFEGMILKAYFFEILVDCFISILFLISAINMNIKLVHGVNPDGLRYLVYAGIFLIVTFITKEYMLFVNKYGNIYE